MNIDDFDYELPRELVAHRPAPEREDARLLVHRIGASAGETLHASVADLPSLLAPGDLVVLNDTRVRPQRLFGSRATGGAVELLLLERTVVDGGGPAWRARVQPARKLRPGERVALDGGAFAVAVRRPTGPDGAPDPAWIVRLEVPSGEDEEAWLERFGSMPLPPYVERRRGDARDAVDRERYQTVYARVPGAVAAPTAGLHFSRRLLERLAAGGIETAFVTLHVGAGTFEPVKERDLDRHRMHPERLELPAATVAAVRACRARGGRVVAVGTTTVRVLESRAADGPGGVELSPGAGETRLFLRPGDPFRVVDALLTNFHLPKSTLLVLVAAFAGRERVLALYGEAIERRYRFYSYGDAMLLLP